MKDVDIRKVLRDRLSASPTGGENFLLLEELGLCCGSVRADLVLVNGMLKAYEIKSDQDRLNRLVAQASIYNQVFDTVTLAVAERHLVAAKKLVPDWWGIQVAAYGTNVLSVQLCSVREEHPNSCVDPYCLAQLLWRDEAIDILTKLLPSTHFAHKSRPFLWRCLADCVPLNELKPLVRSILRARKGWRVDGLQTPSDGTCQPFSKSSDSQVRYPRSRNRRYSCRPN